MTHSPPPSCIGRRYPDGCDAHRRDGRRGARPCGRDAARHAVARRPRGRASRRLWRRAASAACMKASCTYGG